MNKINRNIMSEKRRLSKIIYVFVIITSLIFFKNQNGIFAQNIRVLTIDKGDVKLNISKIKHLKNTRKLVYPVGKSVNTFGYHYYPESGEITSVECIRIKDNSIFLIDEVHNVIKRINLNDGKLTVSNSLKRNRTYLTSIGFLNNSLYVFTNFDKVFNLDMDLNFKESFIMKDYNGDVYVYSESKDELIIYSLYAFSMNDSIATQFVRINKNNQYSLFPINVNRDKLRKLYQKPQGRAGAEIQLGNILYFQTNDFTYEIPESLKKINNYSCVDVDYSDNYIVSFKANNKRVEIIIYEY